MMSCLDTLPTLLKPQKQKAAQEITFVGHRFRQYKPEQYLLEEVE